MTGRTVTLLEGGVAEEGYVFVHLGPAEECKDCRLKMTCIDNLEAGRRYRVTRVRDIGHECRIHGDVKVVEVEECEFEACIESRLSFPGSTLAFRPQRCSIVLCKNFRYCLPEGLKPGDRLEISSVSERIECPAGRDLRLAKVRRAKTQR